MTEHYIKEEYKNNEMNVGTVSFTEKKQL